MILAHPQWDTVLEFSQGFVTALVVENPDFYRQILQDFYAQLQGDPGKLVLSHERKTLTMTKWVELLDNCLHFELNRKPLLNKICAAMERIAVSEDFYQKTSELLCRTEAFLDELAFSLPGDIVCEKCTVSGLIKGMGVSLRDTYEDPLERLLDYMELVREFDGDKLFITVGLRNFFSHAAIEGFVKSVLDHDYRVLLLDCVAGEKLSMERRLTIDKDLCEF